MRELELDGIHDDGEHVILVDSDGERYTLRVDEALRAAVRRDRPALGMIQAADAAPLRPREIQAMLRSGRSAEDIAEASQAPIDHIRRYEGPVLAEREWTAQRVRTFPVGRGGPSLEEMVSERLAARQASDDTAWDAWRRPDGSWTLELSFSAGGRTRQAHWAADLDNRTVAALDDEARWISDEDAPPEPVRGRARLKAVKSSVYDLEADGSFDEDGEHRGNGRGARPARGSSSVSSDHPAALDDSELDALNARRGLRSVPPPEESPTVWASLDEDAPEQTAWGSVVEQDSPDQASAEDTDVDESLDADQEALLEHSHAAGQDLESPSDAEETEVSDPAADDGGEADDQLASSTEDSPAPVHYQDTVDLTPLPGFDDVPSSAAKGGEEKGAKPQPRKPAKSAKNKRASMPSWDEIVFGSKHD